jgi:hypothetical protein
MESISIAKKRIKIHGYREFKPVSYRQLQEIVDTQTETILFTKQNHRD